MPTVGVSSEVLEDALHADFKSGAPVREHVIQMWFEAVIGSCLDGDTDSLGLALLRENDRFVH